MALSVGDKLGPYKILSTLGAGGMGDVYKAIDTRLGRLVAIKIARTEFNSRFQREARAVASLNHPNICTVHDVGPDYLVMEMVDGETLAERLRSGPLPAEESLRLCIQIAEALEAAHAKGITHRDIKPANIKVTAEGRVKVLDFGLAKMDSPWAGAAPAEADATLNRHDPGRCCDGNAGLYVSGASAWRNRRRTVRRLGVRLRSL
jgi:eukaryotic-like serine/threonine-protein kinase